MAAANVIDSLIISLGLDPSGVREGLAQLDVQLGQAQAAANEFISGVQIGFGSGANAVNSMAAAADNYGSAAVAATEKEKQALDGVTVAANQAAEAVENVGDKSEKGMGRAANEAGKLEVKIKSAETASSSLGREVGQGMKEIVKSIIGPMAIFALMMRTVQGVTGELGKLDELTKKNNLTKEEAIQKQKLLDKYGRDGLEGYRKGKAAIGQLGEAMSRAAWPIVQALIPAVEKIAGRLQLLVTWAEKNKEIVHGFFAGLAVILTTKATPAVLAFGRAWLLNPIGLVVTAVVGLVLVLEDFISWVNDGEAAFAGLWEKLGTPEEVKAGLVWILDRLKSILNVAKMIPGISIIDGLVNPEEGESLISRVNPLRGVMKEQQKVSPEERAQRAQDWQFVDSWSMNMGAAAAVEQKYITGATRNITDQSRHDNQTTVNLTVKDASPATAAQYSVAAVGQAFAQNYNSGVKQGGGR